MPPPAREETLGASVRAEFRCGAVPEHRLGDQRRTRVRIGAAALVKPRTSPPRPPRFVHQQGARRQIVVEELGGPGCSPGSGPRGRRDSPRPAVSPPREAGGHRPARGGRSRAGPLERRRAPPLPSSSASTWCARKPSAPATRILFLLRSIRSAITFPRLQQLPGISDFPIIAYARMSCRMPSSRPWDATNPFLLILSFETT